MVGRRLTQEQFLTKAKAVHGDKFDYSKTVYAGSDKETVFTCPTHGDISMVATEHLRGRSCLACKRRSNTDEFLVSARKIHGDKFDYSKTVYVKSNQHVIITCPVHGDISMTPNNHLNGRACRTCSKSGTTSAFVISAKEVHGDRYDYSQVVYTDSKTKVLIICGKHGTFRQTPNSHLSGKGCLNCAAGRSEALCRGILEERFGVPFPSTWPKWLDHGELDGYNEQMNLAFEYQGIQHYEYFPPFHRNGPADLVRQQERDVRKRLLCKDRGIMLVEVPYQYSFKEPELLRSYLLAQVADYREPTKGESAVAG